jgi:hypothetical protein
MESSADNLFDQAMARYQAGAAASEVLPDFLQITEASPGQSAGLDLFVVVAIAL